jgi:hypothetical protein
MEANQQGYIKAATEFEMELSGLINKHSAENKSGSPDFILAAYLNDCLTAYNKAVAWRDAWHSPQGVPADARYTGPFVSRQ